jgi:hypothetical protein
MEIRQILSALAGLFVMAGYVPYVVSIVRKKTVPAKASWLIWATMDSILLYGMFQRDVVNGQILGTVLVIWIIVVLSFVFGKSGWTRLDKVCLSTAIVALVLVFLNPTWSIVLMALMSFVGAFPTFLSTWEDPSREDKLTWTLFWVSCILAVLAIPRWNFSSGAQPVSLLITQKTNVYIILVIRARAK